MNIPVTVDTDLDEDAVRAAARVLEAHVAGGTTPAACAVLTGPDQTLATFAAGRHTYAEDAPICRPDHLFDLASVTKVVATATVCAILSDPGKLDLDAPIQETIPEAGHDGRVTARALLSHCAGLPAHVHLYRRLVSRDEVIRSVVGMHLDYEPLTKAVYSDMGYILLGEVLERVTGRPLNELFRDLVREPLGLHETVFCPGRSALPRIVPTEDDRTWRGRRVHGEVHDENASVMGGVAPHAGLFSTVGNLATFARLWLNDGTFRGRRLFSPTTAKTFRSRAGLAPDSTWALGWDTVSAEASTSGRHFSPSSHGILGFTGTSIWSDPEAGLAVVLLTNRVHPTRDNWGIKQLRPVFHDAIREGLGR